MRRGITLEREMFLFSNRGVCAVTICCAQYARGRRREIRVNLRSRKGRIFRRRRIRDKIIKRVLYELPCDTRMFGRGERKKSSDDF